MFRQRMLNSFRNAFNGICNSFITERNMKIHAAFAIASIFVGLYVGLTSLEWALVTFAITLVIGAEIFNTAVEAAVDLYIQEYHPLAKVAKDAAAGAVLVCSFGAVIIGVIIFMPYILKLLH